MTAADMQRFWAKVEKTDTCWNWTRAVDGYGYGNAWVDRKLRKSHRVTYELIHGPIPKGLVIDHICHNTRCVNPDHLRAVTHKQNVENFSGLVSTNTSGVRGVSWRKDCNKWHAQLKHHGQRINLGVFENIADAEVAVRDKRNELHTHNDLDRVA